METPIESFKQTSVRTTILVPGQVTDVIASVSKPKQNVTNTMSKKIKQAKCIRFTKGARIPVGNGYYATPLSNGSVRVDDANKYRVASIPKKVVLAMTQLPEATIAYTNSSRKIAELRNVIGSYHERQITCNNDGQLAVGCTIVPPPVIAAARKALKV